MTLEMKLQEKFEEGYEEGKKEGKKEALLEIIIPLLNKGAITTDEAADVMKITTENLSAMLKQ